MDLGVLTWEMFDKPITYDRVQATELRRRPHMVVATPGRLADLLAHAADLRAAVRRCGVLVLDEADRLLEKCFEGPLRTILEVRACAARRIAYPRLRHTKVSAR